MEKQNAAGQGGVGEAEMVLATQSNTVTPDGWNDCTQDQ
jgi:hypothetical protein